MDGEFGVRSAPPGDRGPAARQAGEMIVFPLAIPLRNVGLPSPGVYSIEILIDGQHVESLFVMTSPPPGRESGVNDDSPAEN